MKLLAVLALPLVGFVAAFFSNVSNVAHATSPAPMIAQYTIRSAIMSPRAMSFEISIWANGSVSAVKAGPGPDDRPRRTTKVVATLSPASMKVFNARIQKLLKAKIVDIDAGTPRCAGGPKARVTVFNLDEEVEVAGKSDCHTLAPSDEELRPDAAALEALFKGFETLSR